MSNYIVLLPFVGRLVRKREKLIYLPRRLFMNILKKRYACWSYLAQELPCFLSIFLGMTEYAFMRNIVNLLKLGIIIFIDFTQ